MKKINQKNKSGLNENLTELRKIVSWFENTENTDLEEGIKKVKEGAVLIKAAKAELKEMDNEFKEVEKLLND